MGQTVMSKCNLVVVAVVVGAAVTVIIITITIMLAGTHIFQPLAFESHGPQNASAISFIRDLGHRISQRSGDARETQFLFQRLSVILMLFFLARAFSLPLTTRICNHSTDLILTF